MNGALQPHWIRQNETTKMPRRWIYLDCESNQEPTPKGYRQTWRLAVTAFDDTNPKLKKPKATEWATHKETGELWQWISNHTTRGRRTVLVAHNLAYDLRISDALRNLATLGWTLDGIRIDGKGSWARFVRDKATLVCCDSLSWLPLSLERIGSLIGAAKLPLPAWDDSDAEWEGRCRRDVEILRDAMTEVWQWLETEDCGCWQMTGAGCAWSAWRHKHLTHKILAPMDPEQQERERRASWTGRCEAWKHGTLTGGPWVELDLEMAYATIAAQTEVPTKFVSELQNPTEQRLKAWCKNNAVLAEVEVTTEVPCVPTVQNDKIVWPVGTFTTTLWSPELRLLFQNGGSVSPLRVWGYRSDFALSSWAEWVIPLAQGFQRETSPLVQILAKQWSRQLIGRFGLRYAKWELEGTVEGNHCQLLPGIDLTTGLKYRRLLLGDQVYLEGKPEDSPNAAPSIMAYIMSECRARLWKLMVAAGLENVAYVDTDSLIVNREGQSRLLNADLDMPAVTLKQKGNWRTLTIYGPRSLSIEGALRAAGTPRGIEQTGPGEWEGTVWRSLAHSLQKGDPAAVYLETRRFKPKGSDSRRAHLPGGQTAPYRLDLPG